MMTTTYRTGEIAKRCGLHPNTVRLYEQLGWICAPQRRQNGYRMYTALHFEQLRLVRVALRAEVLQNGLRKQALYILRLSGAREWNAAVRETLRYAAMLREEGRRARAATACAEAILCKAPPEEGAHLRRKQAAKQLGVTVDTLRNWELNGLLRAGRMQNGYRVYGAGDMRRLAVIRALRSANYSLAAILRLLNRLDARETVQVQRVLDTPGEDEDVVSACDRLVVSLLCALQDARAMRDILRGLRENRQTLQ